MAVTQSNSCSRPINPQFVEEIDEILELDDRSLAQDIAKKLIEHGRQGLRDFENHIAPSVFRTQMNPSASELLTLLTRKFETFVMENSENWFQTLLNEQKQQSRELYNRILAHFVDQPDQSLDENVHLRLVIGLLLESVDNQIYESLITFGLQGLDQYAQSIASSLLREQRDNHSPLYRLLQNYFHPLVTDLFRRARIHFTANERFSTVLESVVRHGIWHGLRQSSVERCLSTEEIEGLIDQFINNVPEQPQDAEEFQMILSCIRSSESMHLSALIQAGELIYMNKGISDILREILDEYQNDQSLPSLIHRSLIPIMYFLKRQYNLKSFMDEFFFQCRRRRLSSTRFSLRMFIDVLLLNADHSLSRKVISLLSERNPVPFLQPIFDNQSEIRFVSDLIHIWNYSVPTVLSFGIGPCKGKSHLLNQIFLTSFEQSVSGIYFQNTIDIDFGRSCLPQRPVNIADAHGSLKQSFLKSISPLFEGFLVQVNYQYLRKYPYIVQDYLNLIPNRNTIALLIVRDVGEGDEASCRSYLSSNFPSMCSLYLENLKDKTDRDIRLALAEFQEALMKKLPTKCSKDRVFLRNHLRRLMKREYHRDLDLLEETITPLESALLNISQKSYLVEHYFPKYRKFVDLCQAKLALIHHYFDEHDDEAAVKRLSSELVEAKQAFRLLNDDPGDLFDLFYKLLEPSDSITTLEFLGTRLKQERSNVLQKGEMAMKIPIEESLSLEVLWRNAMITSEYQSNEIQKTLETKYFQYVQNGFPFEIIDGDNFFFQHLFLTKSLALLPKKRLLVISIIGPQNSGKSTLFNYMFGSLFDVRDGRCTRGIYGSLIDSNCDEFDQILLIDTEGLLSLEREDPEFDRQILLFCLALSHIVIVNVSKELTSTLQTLLTLSIDSLSKMDVTRIDRPIIHFVLNQKTDLQLENNKLAIDAILRDLKDHQLDQFVQISRDTFHALPVAFQQEGQYGSSKLRQTVPSFLEHVRNLGQKVIESGKTYFTRSKQTWTILPWLSLVRIIFETLQQFPHLTRYPLIDDRRIHQIIRKQIQTTLKEICSSDFFETIPENLDETYFKRWNDVRDECRNELQEFLTLSKASDSLRNRAEKYQEIQIKQIFDSFRRSAKIQQKEEKIRSFIGNGNEELRRSIIDGQFNSDFEQMFSSIIDQTKKDLNIDGFLRETMKFIYGSYSVYEIDALLEYTYLIHHLSLFDQSKMNGRSIDQEKTEFLQHFMRLGYEYTPVMMEEIPSTNTPICLNTINQLKYLNRDLLRRDYLTFTSASAHGNNTVSSKLTGFLRGCFSSSSSNSSPNETSLLEYYFHIRKILQEQRRSIRKNSFIVEKGFYLPMSPIFQRLIDRLAKITVTNLKQLRLETIPTVIETINALIKEINDDLGHFSLKVSRHLKSSFHTCAVMFLTKQFHQSQSKSVENIFSLLEKKKEDLQRYYDERSEPNPSVDVKQASSFAEKFEEHLKVSFYQNAQYIIDKEMKNPSKYNRKAVQKECDQQLLVSNNIQWCLRYLKDPIGIIEEKFEEFWKKDIEPRVGQELIDRKSRYFNLIDEFFHCLEGFFNVIRSFDSANTLIDDIFLSDSQNALTIYENFLNKKYCLAHLLYSYLVESKALESINIDRRTYHVHRNISDGLLQLMHYRKASKPLAIFTKEMSIAYRQLAISAPITFFESLLKQKDRLRHSFERIPSDLQSLDTEKISTRLRTEIHGCAALCPCCHRPCDVDHPQLPSFLNEHLIKHACQRGHGLQAFAGHRFEDTNDALLMICDQIKDETEIIVESKKIRWDLFRLQHSQWSFQSKLTEEEKNQARVQWLVIWERLGREICRRHLMNYVTYNTERVQPADESDHFILVIDRSARMDRNRKWPSLLKALQAFANHRITLNHGDRFSLIQFDVRHDLSHRNQRFEDFKKSSLSYSGSPLGLNAALTALYNLFSELERNGSFGQPQIEYRVILISGGIDGYDENEFYLHELRKKYLSRIKQFVTIGFIDDPSISRDNLEKIDAAMNGIFLDVSDSKALVEELIRL